MGTFKLVDNISIYFYLTYKSHCKFGLFGLFHFVDKTLTVNYYYYLLFPLCVTLVTLVNVFWPKGKTSTTTNTKSNIKILAGAGK